MENSFLMVKLGSHLFILIKTPNNKIMKTSFPVFLSIMVDICFFSDGRNCPSIRKGRRNPNYMPAMLSGRPHSLWMKILSGFEILNLFAYIYFHDNYARQFVCIFFWLKIMSGKMFLSIFG